MTRRSEILKLPVALRCDLDEKLRTNAYGDYVALSDWLEGQGFGVSKSSIHRYGRALRKIDADDGALGPRIAAEARRHEGSPGAQRDELLLELGRLHYRQQQLLAQIAQLDSGMM